MGAPPDVTQTAINLARNNGWHVFPCRENDKRPCWPVPPSGKGGFHQASTDPVEITRLFSHRAAGLIGVRTGEASGVSVLDVDVKHDTALAWWAQYKQHLPRTRTYRTRGGGLHLYFRHAPGVRISESVITEGIDTRGEGGYAIHWFAHGFECLDHSPPAAWPDWISLWIWPPEPIPAPPSPGSVEISEQALERVRMAAIRKCADAKEGTRHAAIRDASLMLGGIQARAGFSDADAAAWLLDPLGLQKERKANKTISWGLAKGRAKPLEIRNDRN
jgi:Bifunctional DNA primase/polymerase, N-terminal